MKYKIKVYSIWEYGQRKDSEGNPHQEDCTFPLPENLKDSDRTFILCDGMGGHDAGEVASATVCEAMGNYILNDGHDAEGVFTDEYLKNAIDAAFLALDKKDSGTEKKMGTTMTFLKLHNNGATIAHMGDSRVYQIRPGDTGEDTQILFETEDHSLVNDLVRINELTREEARKSKQKNVITRAMQPGLERKPKADVKHIADIKAGDFFYMCSDGMLEQDDMESGESLKNIFSNAILSVGEKVRILTAATKHNRDNHTALIIHIEDVEGETEKCEEEPTSAPKYDMAEVEEEPAEELSEKTSNASAEKKSLVINMHLPKSKSGLLKMILGGVMGAFIVIACFAGVSKIPSCTGKKANDKVEIGKKDGVGSNHKDNVKNRKERQNPRVRVLPQQEAPKTDVPKTENANPINEDAAQAVTNDKVKPKPLPKGKTTKPNESSDPDGGNNNDKQPNQGVLIQ